MNIVRTYVFFSSLPLIHQMRTTTESKLTSMSKETNCGLFFISLLDTKDFDWVNI